MRFITRVSTAVLAASALCAASLSSAGAQPTFEVGVKGGVGLTSLSGSNLTTTLPFYADLGGSGYMQGSYASDLGDMGGGFVGGAYAAARVNERLGIRLEALYSVKGARGSNSGVIGIYDLGNNLIGTMDLYGTNTLTLSYFEVPVLAVMYFPASTAGSFAIFAGPSLGFESKAELEEVINLSSLGPYSTTSQTTDIGNFVAGTDFGGVLGLGYSHRGGGVVLSADARWTEGFSEIIENSSSDWKNRAFSLSVGIGVPLGGAK